LIFKQPVRQIMRKTPVREVKESDPVARAIQIMDQCDISALPVRSKIGGYCGVISKSDIASMRMLSVLNVQPNPLHIQVRDVMNRTPPIYVMEDDPIQEAITQMHRRHIHRLFVADADYQLVGVISTTDILRLLVVS
jgi:CBS domain-containing protein